MDKVNYETYDSNDVYDSMEPSSTEKKVIVFGLLFEKKRCIKINLKLPMTQHQKRFNVSFKAPKVIRPQNTERDGIKRKVGKTFNLE